MPTSRLSSRVAISKILKVTLVVAATALTTLGIDTGVIPVAKVLTAIAGVLP